MWRPTSLAPRRDDVGTFTMIAEDLESLGYIDDPVTNGDHYQYT